MGKVVVLGSINQDFITQTKRLPDAGETVHGTNLIRLPGGKGANAAVAIAAAEVASVLLGTVGNDSAGEDLLGFLKQRGVDTTFVRTEHDVTSGTAIITVDEHGENTIVVIPGANGMTKDNSNATLRSDDVLLSQFEVPMSSIVDFFDRGRDLGCTTILNPSPVVELQPAITHLVDILVINEVELATYGKGIVTEDRNAIAQMASQLVPSGSVVVTLGANGAIAVGKQGAFDIPGIPVDVVDTTGAGDCFVGSLAAETARGESFEPALHYANRAAALCVTRQGAAPAMSNRNEVLAAYRSQ